MPWNANNNQPGEVRAPGLSAALARQKQQQVSDINWALTLRAVALNELPGTEKGGPLDGCDCALLHPLDFPPELADTGLALVHPRLHAQFVVAARRHESVSRGCIALLQPQMINLELCVDQSERWTLFQDRVPPITVMAIEIRPLPVTKDDEEDEEEAEVSEKITTDASAFAAFFSKTCWTRVLTENERLVVRYSDGRDYFVRVLEIEAEDEFETEFTMPDTFRGAMDEDTRVLVSLDGVAEQERHWFELLHAQEVGDAGLSAHRSDVVTVVTSDDEEFPVKKKLLFPCIKLSSAVLSGHGVHKDSTNTIDVAVDCCTFDRVLLYLEHEARNDGSDFAFDPSYAEELLTAAETVGCIGLQDVCKQRLGEFETRVRKEAIRWEEVLRRNAAGEVWLVMLGMVFDITRWLPEHPGGSTIIPAEAVNVDSTVMFEIFHSSRQSFRYLKQFYIGEIGEQDLPLVPKSSETPSDAFVQELQQYTTWRVKPEVVTYKSF